MCLLDFRCGYQLESILKLSQCHKTYLLAEYESFVITTPVYFSFSNRDKNGTTFFGSKKSQPTLSVVVVVVVVVVVYLDWREKKRKVYVVTWCGRFNCISSIKIFLVVLLCARGLQ